MLAADFGDAPAPYKTLIANSGAQHEAVGPTLGALRDTEADGVPSAAADGDGADDDGVTFGNLRAGQLGATVTVNVQSAPAGAKLDAWIDFNGDGTWGGPGEQIANNRAVVADDNAVTFDVPGSALPGNVFARFRLSTAGNLSPSGAAADGEVEDYRIIIAPPGAASGNFSTEKVVTTLPDQAYATDAVDVDGDGDMDILSAGLGTATIRWHENNGSEVFTARDVGTGDANTRQILGADVDGDGDMDVVAASSANPGGRILWFENNGSETFTLRTLATQNGTFGVVIADIDGDGDMDAASVAGDRLRWHRNNGSQTFTSIDVPGTATQAIGVNAADVDSDGDMDLLSASSGDDTIAWYDNNGSQTFTKKTVTSAADGARAVIAADLDDDGDIDVVAASSGDDRVAWHENNGSEVFTPHDISTAGDQAWNIDVADMDGDGDLDVVSAAFMNDEVSLHINNGSGAFTSRLISASGDGPRTIAAGDVDGDGDLDVVTASSADDSILWYENRPTGDYDRDLDIDGADFLLWQRDFGAMVAAGSGADGNGNATVDSGDLALWATGFGQGSTTASSSGAASSNLVASADGPVVGLGPESNWFVTSESARITANGAHAAVEAKPAAEEQRDTALAALAPAAATGDSGDTGLLILADAESAELPFDLVDELFAAWAGVA
jgi:hypothetical protein